MRCTGLHKWHKLQQHNNDDAIEDKIDHDWQGNESYLAEDGSVSDW